FVKAFEGEELSKEAVQYKEYAQWEKEQKENGVLEKQEEYWKDVFKGEIPVLELPMDGIRGKIGDTEGERIHFEIGEETVKSLKEAVKSVGGTLYMGLMAGFSILLSRYSGQEDIVIGSPIAGRRHAQLEKIAGVFINTLAIRTKPEGEKSVKAFLAEVKQTLLGAYENQEFPYEELVEGLDVERDLSRNPLFDVMLVLQNMEIIDIKLPEVNIKECKVDDENSQFDISLIMAEDQGKLRCEIEYRSKLYSKSSMKQMIAHYTRILEQIGNNLNESIKNMEILNGEEKDLILKQFNDTKVEYDKNKTVIDFFEEQVLKNPDAIAVVHGDEKLTYGQLNDRANRVAQQLRKAGVEAESIVAIISEADSNFIVSVIGVLKSGGAYLPILPEYPMRRIQYMLEDSGASIILNQSGVDLEGCPEVIDLYEEDYVVTNRDIDNINFSKTDNLAYVIYTSGSTGQPKGVLVEHKSLNNIVSYFIHDCGFGKMKEQMLFAQIVFDVSVLHVFTPLYNGNTLHLMTDILRTDYNEMYKYVKKNNIGFIDLVPAQMEVMLEHLDKDCSNIRFILGGEAFPVSLHQKIISRINPEGIYNAYGPTETTVTSLLYKCRESEKGKVIPVGKPVRNYRVYILDKYNKIQPIGVPGELCISGDGLARGYLNQDKLTVEKFVENPYEPGEKMYRTGDLTRWLVDGSIEFLGRIDHQVKIRGYRIELEEIENVIVKQPGVKEAVVLVREQPAGEKFLCGYIVKEANVSIYAIKEGIGDELPEYMVPSVMVEIDEIPLTENGKIDRKALLDIEVLLSKETEYEAPRNDIEAKLVSMWEDILEIDRVGIHDNFFELGGHSLKATVLSGRIQKELEINVGVRDIFEKPTIIGLAEHIMKGQNTQYELLKPLEKSESYPVSSAQRRMYVVQMMDSTSTAYNMPMALELTGNVDRVRIEKAIEALINKHEALRTSFHMEGEEIVQRIHEKGELKLQYIEVEGEEKAEEIMKGWMKPFELDKCPIMRGGIIKAGNKYLLMLDMHHIVSDAVTMNILAEDFVKAFEGEELSKEAVQYKEYAQWEKEQKENGVWEKQKEYWKDVFKGEIPVLELPMDGIRGQLGEREVERLQFEIEEKTVNSLKEAVKSVGGTLYMGLMAGLSILLSRYSGQKDLVIGSPIAGRRHAQLEKIAGVFINTLAIRTKPEGEKSVKNFLAEVKQTLLDAYENQEFPYEELVEELNVERDLSRNPLYDVMLVLHNADMEEIELPEVQIRQYEIKSERTKLDITLNIEEVSDKLICEVEYKRSLYNRNSMEQMMKHYIKILEEICSKDEEIKSIELLDEQEKELLLRKFNDTRVEYPKNRTIVDLFEAQVEKTPDQIAVVFEDKQLTYRE
ncbi:non-ribosomal peptide synthetase, partial [Oceanobacillus picturae]|uniref:non-ribosomal peptide synthetase n=1 Tax=Oceanobacillus picturae TaxID=171693 RepID=UPI000E6996D6